MADKPWKCQCGAVLGLISWDDNDIPQLLLYRHAVDMNADHPAEVEVLGALMGRMPVECDGCGRVQVWWPSAQTMLALLDMLNVEQIRQFAEAFLMRKDLP
jgi:hypothetical protein